MRAAALMAARRWSSSSMRFCLQNLAISRFVTLTKVVLLAQNLGAGGGGGGGGGEFVCLDFEMRQLVSTFISFIIKNLLVEYA